MAAPERFRRKPDSSCTAGAVHTWPFATVGAMRRHVRSWVNSGSGWNALEALNLAHSQPGEISGLNLPAATLPPESPAGRRYSQPFPRLCFEIAGVMALVQLI